MHFQASSLGVSQRTEVASSPRSGFGSIADLLIDCQERRVSGIVCIDALRKDKIEKSTFAFREGRVIYAGSALPTPDRFLIEVSQHLQVPVMQEAIEFAGKRSSVRKVMAALVKVGVVSWPEVTAALRFQVFSLLSELKGASGRIYLDRCNSSFDLHCDNGMPGFAIDELLAETKTFEQ